MAGDWIKMRVNLDTDCRVLEIASELEITELHVVGCLWKVWAWADQHSLDGNALRVTCVTLDRFVGVSGFAEALRKVGWLEGRDHALSFPRFAEHNGQTAKTRAETNKRVAKHRNAKTVTDVTQKALPEKRREEKIEDTHTPGENLALRLIPEELHPLWGKFLDSYRTKTGQRMPDVQQEAVAMDLGRRGPKAKADLEFSILKGAKSVLDSAHDFQQRPASTSGNRQTKGQKITQEAHF